MHVALNGEWNLVSVCQTPHYARREVHVLRHRYSRWTSGRRVRGATGLPSTNTAYEISFARSSPISTPTTSMSMRLKLFVCLARIGAKSRCPIFHDLRLACPPRKYRTSLLGIIGELFKSSLTTTGILLWVRVCRPRHTIFPMYSSS